MHRRLNSLSALEKIALCAAALLTLGNAPEVAAATAAQFASSPFIAADKADTKEFTAKVQSGGARSPYLISANQHPTPPGTYSGVVIKPNQQFTGFQTIRFDTDATFSQNVNAFQPCVGIQYTTPGGHITNAYVQATFATKGEKSKDGFVNAVFSARSFGIANNSFIHKIVITGNSNHQKGQFQADNICINDVPVDKDLSHGTVFYNIANGSDSGPLSLTGKASKTALTSRARTTATTGDSASTSIKVTNRTGEPILVYLTLGTTPGCVIDIHQVPFVTAFNNASQGSFTLGANASQTYTPPGNMGFGGNFAFGTPPNNCPPPEFPNGISLGEFIINNAFQGPYAQETLDISTVDGCNARMRFSLTGGQPWNAGAPKNITQFENKGLYENVGVIGVFPYQCDNCATSDHPPHCPSSPPNRGCQPSHICNVQRTAPGCGGGTVELSFLGMIK